MGCKPVPIATLRQLDDSVELLKAMADPHRLRILATLARENEDVCVCDLNGGLPLSQPTVSHHLGLLRSAGLVKTRRRGTWIYYRLAEGIGARLTALQHSILPRRSRK
jgi:DNA-binding transcriptional ArsR family regulator